MNRWLLAAILTSAVVPTTALVVSAHRQSTSSQKNSSAALGDAIVDDVNVPYGLPRNPLTLLEVSRSVGSVSYASGMLTGPVLIRTQGHSSAVARLEGIELGTPRMMKLRRLMSAGDIGLIARERGSAAMGQTLAQKLDIRIGDSVEIVSLAPGPEALGFRRQHIKIIGFLGANLSRYEEDILVTRLEDARQLLGTKNGLSGAQTWFDSRLQLDDALARLTSGVGGERRVRQRRDRDWPRYDAHAAIANAQASLLTVLLIALFALPLVGLRRRGSYGSVVASFAPVAGVTLLLSLLAAAGMVVFFDSENHRLMEWLGEARFDLARLVFTVVLGLLASPILSERFSATGAAAALAALIAVASVESTGASVVASGTYRTVTQLAGAARTTERLVATDPLRAVVSRGAEISPIELYGVDPQSAATTKLLDHLRKLENEELRPLVLRPEGTQKPALWHASQEPMLNDLLEQLATTGQAGQPVASSSRKAPAIVLGHALARRLGANVGEEVTIAAAPPDVGSQAELDPPWPQTFRVEAIAQLGLRSIDDRLALADTWQVEALGGRPRSHDARRENDATGILTMDDNSPSLAARPFEERARRSAITAALQLSLAAFLLGCLIARESRKGRRWNPLALVVLWVVVGALAGILLGFNEGAGGLIEIGDSLWYEALPKGRALSTDVIGFWTFFPAITSGCAAMLGVLYHLTPTLRKGRR